MFPTRRSQKTKGAVYAGLFFIEVIIPMLFDGFAAHSGRGSKVANAWQTACCNLLLAVHMLWRMNTSQGDIVLSHVVSGKKTLQTFTTASCSRNLVVNPPIDLRRIYASSRLATSVTLPLLQRLP